MIKVTKKCKISKKELKLGIPIEMEHTTSKKKAKHIAEQHLCEFPTYYSKGLIPMEKMLKRGEKVIKTPMDAINYIESKDYVVTYRPNTQMYSISRNGLLYNIVHSNEIIKAARYLQEVGHL